MGVFQEFLIEALSQKIEKINILSMINEILRLFSFRDEPIGYALRPASVDKKRGREISAQPVLIGFARLCFGKDVDSLFFAALENLFLSPVVADRFPEVWKVPTTTENPIIRWHRNFSGYPMYDLLAPEIHKWMISFWIKNTFSEKTVSQFVGKMTGINRLLPELDPKRFTKTREESIFAWCEYVHMVGMNLLSESGKYELQKDTKIGYLDKFADVLDQPELRIRTATERKGTRRVGGTRFTPDQLIDFDGDLPECHLTPDGFRIQTMNVAVEKSMAELNPEVIPVSEDLNHTDDRHRFIYSDEFAVLAMYDSEFSPHSHSSDEIAWLISHLWENFSADRESREIATVIILLIMTGRSISFFLSLKYGDGIETSHVDKKNPIYLSEKSQIQFLPAVIDRLPRKALMVEDLFYPVNRYWTLPLPDWINKKIKEFISPKKPGDNVFLTTRKKVLHVLSRISSIYRKIFPSAPPFRESSLSNASRFLFTQYGKLNHVYFSMISDRWLPYVQVPIFYTAVRVNTLAKHYFTALDSVWSEIRLDKPTLPPISFQNGRPFEAIYQGTPYCPRLDEVKAIVIGLAEYVKGSSSSIVFHNRITVTAAISLALFCGIRFGQVVGLQKAQVNFLKNDFSFIVLDRAKTSRFTTAARMIPISTHVETLLMKALNSHDEISEFFCVYDAQENPRPFTKHYYKKYLKEADIKALRWHAGRHLLHSLMLESGIELSVASAILGHETAGMELFNRYTKANQQNIWHTYLDFCDDLAEIIGWEVIENEMD